MRVRRSFLKSPAGRGLVAGAGVLAATLASLPAIGQPSGVAYLAVDLRTGVPLARVGPAVLDAPVRPGSIVKIATLAAALESRAIDGRTGILCTRETIVGGRRLACTHPDLHRPLKPAEALAHSCNVFFATVAARLPRAAFDAALTDLGLPPSDTGRPIGAAALGLEGVSATPRQLLSMLARVAVDPSALPWRGSTLEVIREGLRGAATYGTASALADRGVDALAKTGTTASPGGSSQGLVVGVTPARRPDVGFVLLAAGGAGMDAAALAADRLRPPASPAQAPTSATAATVRVGVARQSGGYTVRTMAIDDYVAGVVAGEAAANSPASALEALAMTARTFAEANRSRHREDGFEVCDLTHCQVLRRPTTATQRAAAATSGQVLLYEHAAAPVFYTASCGGHTEHPSAVWPGAPDPPFLPAREDDACEGEPAWSSEIAARDLTRALRSAGFGGDLLRDLTIAGRSRSGRVTWLRVAGMTPDQVSAQNLQTLVGRTLGWQHIRSTAFELRRTGAGFRFDGHGAGHGVGLCVIGAARRAARGESAQAILQHYFPGLSIGAPDTRRTIVSSRVVVALPEADDRERAVVQDFATRALGGLQTTLGVEPPGPVTLRFHPTVESYQRATRQRWFTSAATRGTNIDLLPLRALRRRGLLERTIRHELVHVLTAPGLSDRPLWVVEGAAAYFTKEPLRSDSTRGARAAVQGTQDRSCPSDAEIRDAGSPDALRVAYAKAEGCFEREIEAGQTWRTAGAPR